MKKTKRTRLIMLALVAAMIFASFGGLAVTAKATEEIMTRAEITGYKYVYLNDVKFKRLWSYTYGYWIDPSWTLA